MKRRKKANGEQFTHGPPRSGSARPVRLSKTLALFPPRILVPFRLTASKRIALTDDSLTQLDENSTAFPFDLNVGTDPTVNTTRPFQWDDLAASGSMYKRGIIHKMVVRWIINLSPDQTATSTLLNWITHWFIQRDRSDRPLTITGGVLPKDDPSFFPGVKRTSRLMSNSEPKSTTIILKAMIKPSHVFHDVDLRETNATDSTRSVNEFHTNVVTPAPAQLFASLNLWLSTSGLSEATQSVNLKIEKQVTFYCELNRDTTAYSNIPQLTGGAGP